MTALIYRQPDAVSGRWMGQERRWSSHKYSVSQCCASGNTETNTIYHCVASLIWVNPSEAVNQMQTLKSMHAKHGCTVWWKQALVIITIKQIPSFLSDTGGWYTTQSLLPYEMWFDLSRFEYGSEHTDQMNTQVYKYIFCISVVSLFMSLSPPHTNKHTYHSIHNHRAPPGGKHS